MGLQLNTTYDNANPPSSGYPQGSGKNDSGPGLKDGLPYEQTWFNDIYGFLQKLVADGNITISGNADSVIESDYFNGLKNLFSRTMTFRQTNLVGNAYRITAIESGVAVREEYNKNSLFLFKALVTNTGAPTLQIDSLAPKDLTFSDGSEILGDTILEGRYYLVLYNSVQDRYELVTLSGAITPLVNIEITTLLNKKPTGSLGGGATVSSTWNTVPLNFTQVGLGSGIILAGNAFSLPQGRYYITGYTCVSNQAEVVLRLVEGLPAAPQDTLLMGQIKQATNEGDEVSINGIVTVPSFTTAHFQLFATSNEAEEGFGRIPDFATGLSNYVFASFTFIKFVD